VRIRQLLLDQLKRGQRDIELLPIQRILPCLLDAVLECPDNAKADSEACVAARNDTLAAPPSACGQAVYARGPTLDS
jgi:hypothetical protein